MIEQITRHVDSMKHWKNKAVSLICNTSLLILCLYLSSCIPLSDHSLSATQSATVAPAIPPSATPTPTPVIEVRDSDEFPHGCTDGAPAELVISFLDAVNRGDLDQLRRMLPEAEGSYSQAGIGNLGLIGYGVASRDLGDFGGGTREQVLTYFRERHQYGEQQHLRTFQIHSSHTPGSVDIVFKVVLEADDLPPTVFDGKGAIDCLRQTIYLWAMTDGSRPQ